MTQYDSVEEAGRDPEWVAEKAVDVVWARASDERVTILAFGKLIKYAQAELRQLADEHLPPPEEWDELGVDEEIKEAYRV